MPGRGRPFKKGESKGRPKGAVNKVTGTLKEMILESLAKAGGVDYLLKQSKKFPGAYLSLIGRVLPLQVHESSSQPMMPKVPVHEHHDS